ncbi:hypothetical protein E3Q01_00845, partial [Wallemia mellicola]
LDNYSINLIVCHQVVINVILDLQGAIKELIENSLDASSTVIEINLFNFGLDTIKVVDNGNGIDLNDFNSIAKKHFTSKLNTFTDLSQLQTFGFRGEALSSLCSISKSIECLTSTKSSQPKANRLLFNKNGELVESKSNVPRQSGTTMSIFSLFHHLPVRRRELEKNIKREFSKAINLLQSYALCPLLADKKFIVTNTNKSNKKSLIFQSTGKSLLNNITSIFGSNTKQDLVPLDLDLPVKIDSNIAKRENVDELLVLLKVNGLILTVNYREFTVQLQGTITKPLLGLGRSTSDRQYFYINGRPCNMPKAAKAINQVFKSYNIQSYPLVIADFKVPMDTYDVNITPDKRTIFLHFESSLLESLKDRLDNFYEPFRGVFNVNKATQSSIVPKSEHLTPQTQDESSNSPLLEMETLNEVPANPLSSHFDGEDINEVDEHEDQDDDIANIQDEHEENEREETPLFIDEQDMEKTPLDENSDMREDIRTNSQINTRHASWASEAFSDIDKDNNRLPKRRKTEVEFAEIDEYHSESEKGMEADNHNEHDSFFSQIDTDDTQIMYEIKQAPLYPNIKQSQIDTKTMNDTQERIELSDSSEEEQSNHFTKRLNVNIDEISLHWQINVEERQSRRSNTVQKTTPNNLLDNAGIQNVDDAQSAENALSRVLHKNDFERLQVLGQFNLGFMIVRRLETNSQGIEEEDLFIVDQHAADEKYNFENLQLNHKIQSQKLIIPRTLDLSASDELVVFDNLDILKSNGFDIQINEDAASGNRCQLVSLPLSKSTVFDLKDLEELIHFINESPGKLVRCTKARDLFASRACRMSVMVGKSLKLKQMTKIVRNLSTLNQPWNCPHGRPTLRHLINLNDKTNNDTRVKINWQYFI